MKVSCFVIETLTTRACKLNCICAGSSRSTNDESRNSSPGSPAGKFQEFIGWSGEAVSVQVMKRVGGRPSGQDGARGLCLLT